MKCFVVVYLSDGSMPNEGLSKVRKHYEVIPGKVWIVADPNDTTTDDIRLKFDMTNDAMLGAIFEVGNYSGYGPQALWEYIQTWRSQ